jgi:hypothetical protein
MKGFEQLGRFRSLWREPGFAQRIGAASGLELGAVAGIITCVVTGNRLFSGYIEDGHAVRNIYELVNAVTGGYSEFGFPKHPDVPEAMSGRFVLKYWRGDTIEAADLEEFLGGGSLHGLALDSMEPFDEVIPFGRTELRFRTFRLNLLNFDTKLRQHSLARPMSSQP